MSSPRFRDDAHGVFVGKVRYKHEFAKVISALDLKSDEFILKPNWVSGYYADYTDAETLKLTLDSLDGKKTIVEAHTDWRRSSGEEERISSDPIKAKSKLPWLRAQEDWFLNSKGIRSILERGDVRYINVTEEVWSGQTADSHTVKKLVEEKYGKVVHEELYAIVPKKLFELRGKPLISLARIKICSHKRLATLHENSAAVSLSLKNLFGLIPDPRRGRWHGPGDSNLSNSILGINKVYSALFEIVGINEGIRLFKVIHDKGRYQMDIGGEWGMQRYDVFKNLGIVIGGKNLVNVDAFTLRLFGLDPVKVQHIRACASLFGMWDENLLKKADAVKKKLAIDLY